MWQKTFWGQTGCSVVQCTNVHTIGYTMMSLIKTKMACEFDEKENKWIHKRIITDDDTCENLAMNQKSIIQCDTITCKLIQLKSHRSFKQFFDLQCKNYTFKCTLCSVHMACAKDNWIRYFMTLTADNATTNDKLKWMCENEAAIDNVSYFK